MIKRNYAAALLCLCVDNVEKGRSGGVESENLLGVI